MRSTKQVPSEKGEVMNYCSNCGAEVALRIPDGDNRNRYVCDKCGIIHYHNPRVVAGAIPAIDHRILLCRRAIEPRRGWWTIPAGYLENGETVEQCARRETLEEAGARLEDIQPYCLLNLSFVNQIYFVYRAGLFQGRFHPGEESLDVDLFPLDRIPWDELAFHVVREVLELYCRDAGKGRFYFRERNIEAHGRLGPSVSHTSGRK